MWRWQRPFVPRQSPHYPNLGQAKASMDVSSILECQRCGVSKQTSLPMIVLDYGSFLNQERMVFVSSRGKSWLICDPATADNNKIRQQQDGHSLAINNLAIQARIPEP